MARGTSEFEPQRHGRQFALVMAAGTLALSAVLAGCSSSDGANATDGADAAAVDTSSTVPDDPQLPLIDPNADAAAGDASTATTAVPTDPAVDAQPTQVEPGADLNEVIASAVDPTTGDKLSDLAPLEDKLPDTWTLNSRGAEVRLDEAALLACANNQFAWVDLQANNPTAAAGWLGVAAARAAQSHVGEVSAQANALAGAWRDPSVGAGTVDQFLTLCTERGFEV